MTKFDQIARKIIGQQELIVGPLAWNEAMKVAGIKIANQKSGEVFVQNGDPRLVIDSLVRQYENLFGKASHEVCREVARDLIKEMAEEEVPESLR